MNTNHTRDPRHGYFLEELRTGMSAQLERTISDEQVIAYSEVSGDNNPLHLDPDFARGTRFGGCIAHGMLTASLISAVIGTRLPGPGCIYLSQSLRFTAPVRVGDTVCACVSVRELVPGKPRVKLVTECRVGETLVLSGEALVYVPPRNAEDERRS